MTPVTRKLAAVLMCLGGALQFVVCYMRRTPDPDHYLRNLNLFSGTLFMISGLIFAFVVKNKSEG